MSCRRLLDVLTGSRTLAVCSLVGLVVLSEPAAQADVYVANSNSNDVSASIQGAACGFFNGRVPVGASPAGVAVSPDGTRVYVTNSGSGTVSVIDTATKAVTATLTVGGSPLDVAMHPDGSRLYVIAGNSVSVVNTASGTVMARVFLAGSANRVTIHPAGTRVYVTAGGQVEVIDTASNAVIARVPVATIAGDVAVNPAGTLAYVTDLFGPTGRVLVMDTASNTVIATVPVEGAPFSVAVNPSGTRVYVASSMNVAGNEVPGKLIVLDTASNAVIMTQTIGANPYEVAVDRSRIYVTTDDGGGSQGYIGHLWVFDGASNAFVAEEPVGGIPAGVATFMNPLPPPLPTNVQVTGMEVTQAIQDLANSVPLVAGRKTFVRVHVKSEGPAVPGVHATLFGIRDVCSATACEAILLGSLVPVTDPITVSPLPKRSNVADSFVFELPWAWTDAAAVRLHAVLGTDAAPPATCRPDAPTVTSYFEVGTTLQVQFIRLAYPWVDKTVLKTVTATTEEQQLSESWIRRAYPLTKLLPTLDMPLRDDGLATRVAQTAKECQDMKAEDRNQCARQYITTKLAEVSVISGIFPPAVVGDADGAYALIPQPPNPDPKKPNPFYTRGACCNFRVGAGPSHRAHYTAHEIGHLLGRQHPVEGAGDELCGHDPVDQDYPYLLSVIRPLFPFDPAVGLAGFDGGDSDPCKPTSSSPIPDPNLCKAIPMTTLGVTSGYDYDNMGYCSPTWISDYTYKKLYTALRALRPGVGRASSKSVAVESGVGVRKALAAQAAAPQMGDWLMVFGSIAPDPATPAYILARRVDRVVTVPPRTPGNNSIRLIGAGGVTVADYPFTPEKLADAAAGGTPALSFGHVVPFVAGTTEIQIVDAAAGGRVLGAKSLSPNPPVIGSVALVGSPDPATGQVTVGWTAEDPDGDPLTFDVFFTRDGGASFQPLVLGFSGSSVEVDTASLGGGVAQFRVMATDGVRSAFADTAPFGLANKPPQARILTPGDGSIIHVGQLVNLEGEATDAQDGVIPETNLAWSLPGRSLGPGARLSITDLPVGVNQLTLTATNSLGLAGTTAVTVIVKDNVALPGPTLTAGPRRMGWHVAVGESQRQTAELEIGNSGGGNLEFTASSSAAWLTLSEAGGTAPATLMLTADPAGFAGGVTAEASVTVTAVGIPGQVITVPVTLSVGNTFVVGNTPPGEVDQCPSDPDKTQPGACGCGVPDSEAGQACATGLPGVCQAGVIACGGGRASCVQNQQPTAESCDGLDNDCNGTADEGNPGGGASCSTGLLGVCSVGTRLCTGGALVCQQTTQPGVEICGNNVDEDCDGVDLACPPPPPPPPPVDGCTPTTVLDTFDRADGSVGSDWRGLTATSSYRIAGHRLDVQAGGPLYWNPAAFGTNQAAFVTLSTVASTSPSQGILLKVQGGSVPDAGAIAVVYDATAHAVRVSTLRLGALAWTPYGNTSVVFHNGDKLGACATATGEVRVYRNDARVKTVTLNAADQRFFNPRGGKVGVWSLLASQAFLDDFGGATIAP